MEKQQGIPNPVPTPRKKKTKGGKMRREKASVFFKRLMADLSNEFPDSSQRSAVSLSYVEKHYGKRGVASVTKKWKALRNPSPSKVKKAKQAFDDFHGGKKAPNVKKETIDIGDVWYSLGECWQIGYLSPKETGNDQQKYTHAMNEESKDGNYPKLYATIPDDGEPMLIIKGGSLCIEKRDDGITWLVD